MRWYGLATSLIGRDPELMDLMARAAAARGLLIGLRVDLAGVLRQSTRASTIPSSTRAWSKPCTATASPCRAASSSASTTTRPRSSPTTARFAVEAGIDLPRFAVVTPFPGTGLYQRLEREGRILTRDWELYDGQHVVFQPRR